jgi:chromosome segregation ATPase
MDGLLQTPKAQNVGAPNIAPPPSDPAAVRLEAEARVSELLKSQKIGLTQQTNLAQQGFATQGEVDAIRLEAKQETQLLQKDFEAREKSLVQEIGQLSQRVAKEEENVAANHQMKNRILETRIQLDKELATLRKEYDADKKKWETAVLDQEKLHNHQLHSSQRDFNKLQDQLNAMQHEYALAKSNSAFTNPTKLAEAEKAANVIFQQRADATLIAEKEKLQAGMMKAQEARAKIETELTALRRKYEYDSYDWKQTMAREIKERDKLVEGKAEEFKKLDAERVKAAEVLDTRDEELAQFKADSVTLHALLTTFQEERINMEGELNLLKAKYEADHQLWQQQMADAGLARAAQEAEIANLSAEITKMLQERAEAVEKPSSMSVLADKLSSRNKNVAKQKELVKSLRAEVAELKEGNANSAGNVDTIQAMSLELETREQELAMQREEIDNLRSGMAEMNNDRADKEGLVASLNKMTAVLATRDKELAKQDLEMVELRATVAKMKKEGPDVQDQLASIKPLKEELAARDKAFFKQKAELKKLQATLTQIHEERAEVDGQLASINAMAAELEARDKDEIKQKVQMEKLQSEITKLKQKRADADGDATKLRTMTRNLAARDKELTKQKAEVDRLRGQMTNLEKERKSERSKSASSRMGTVNENGEKAKMQIELTKMKVERAKLDSELATLKKEHEQERLRWEEQNSGGRDDAEKLAEQKAKLEKLRAEMANVKEERSDMGSFFDRAVGSFFGSND